MHAVSTSVTLIASFLQAVAISGSALAVPVGNACVAAKNTTAAKVFVCLARRQNELLPGGAADPTRCNSRLAAGFARAQTNGDCPAQNDADSAQSRVENAETNVLSALNASSATTEAAKK